MQRSTYTFNKNCAYMAHQHLATLVASQNFYHRHRASLSFNTQFEKINSLPQQYRQIQNDNLATSAFGRNFAASLSAFAPLMAAYQWRNKKPITNIFAKDYLQLQSNFCNKYQNNNNYFSTQKRLKVSKLSDNLFLKGVNNSCINLAATSANSSSTKISTSSK